MISGVLTSLPTTVNVMLAPQACATDSLFLCHKTSIRAQYDLAWKEAESQGAFDMLFCNQQGYVTEGARSNVFIRQDDIWATPPLSDGVLPGVMRSVLLGDADMAAIEKQITMTDVLAADEVILCNSLRGILKVKLVLP